LVQQLAKVPFAADALFAKVDIKHFFMTGECGEISELASAPFEFQPVHPLLRRSCYFLLDSQYILVPTTGGSLKVIKGSGMGLPHSGACSECAFLSGAEASLLRDLSYYSVLFYARFKDDIFIIYRDRAKFASFLHRLSCGHPFNLKVETEGARVCDFLEVTISMSSSAFLVSPYTKPTVLEVPWLSRFSAHCPAVHSTWPLARFRDRQRLCSTEDSRRREASRFISVAEQQYLSTSAVIKMKECPTIAESKLKLCACPQQFFNRKRSSRISLWLTLPFSPVLHASGLAQQISRFSKSKWVQQALQRLFGNCIIDIRIAWCNGGVHTQAYLKAIPVMQEADEGG